MRDEGIVLTDREREALAGLAESIGDPWLARQLTGQDGPPPPPKRRLAGLGTALFRATAGWIGLLLLLAGAALTVATFVHSTVVASFGLVVMGFGAWRVAVERVDALILRWTGRRTPPGAPPAPPHTPPAAV
ncbi:MAG: hypothetical protein AB1679_17765 [Actinomycetota bacterium]